MPRLLPSLSLSLVLLAVGTPAFATNLAGSDSVFRIGYVMMSRLEDGKPSGKYMVVNINVEFSGGRYVTNWDAVRISPIELPSGETLTSLRAQHYSSEDGSIRNLVLKQDVVTFDIVRRHGDLKVVCKRKGEYGYDFDLTVSGVHRSSKRNRTYLEEWVMTDQITLPSLRVFGYPEKKPRLHRQPEPPAE